MHFIKGMDISMLKELEGLGVRYYDNGKEQDIFLILKNYNVNAIRLRLWCNPFDKENKPYGGGTNDLKTTMELADRIHKSGMAFVLDIHYSDFWTDPAKQLKPKAWENVSGSQLEKEVYQYTCGVLNSLKSKGLLPDMVQVGNELTNGFLWPDGKLPGYSSMVRLLKMGIKAVKDIGEDIKIILHLDNGGNNELYREWFDKVTQESVVFDIIGLSYYPYWHGTLDDLVFNMNDISERFNKDIMVMETAYGFTTENYQTEAMIFSKELSGKVPFDPTILGQAEFIKTLLSKIKNVKNQRGKGFFYWEPAWIPVKGTTWATPEGRKYIKDDSKGGNSWANQALFDFNGNALPALKVIRDFN